MVDFILKYGFYRLTLIPIGLAIIIGAIWYGILGMGLIGLVVLIFGLLNKCLLLGQCEIDEREHTKRGNG